MPDLLLFVITFGFLSGVMSGHDFFFGAAAGLIALCGTMYFGRQRQEGFHYRKYVLIILIFISMFIGGYARYQNAQAIPPDHFQSRLDQHIEVTGTITNDPSSSEGKVTAIIYVDGVGIRLTIKTGTKLRYSDTVTVSGTLSLPENFMTDQGTEFDYVSYLKKDKILYLISDAKLVTFTQDTSFSLKRSLYMFRHAVEARLFASMPEQEAGLTAGILLGTKAAIDEHLYNALVATSTVHIVALSGYNVSIVADTIAKILGLFLPRIAGLFLGGLGIILFVLMTGASSTALRAGVMALILIFSRITGRSTHVFRVMALAALAMIIANPMFLVSDVSFQLSFLATIGLLIVSPTYVSWLEKYLPKGLAEAVGTTLAAETAVAPFIMYKMGVFSTIALPVNVMILPFIPLLMLGGFIVICISFTMPLLGTIIGYPTYVLAGGLIGFIGFAARVPFASVHVPEIPAGIMLLLYAWLTWYFIDRTLTQS